MTDDSKLGEKIGKFYRAWVPGYPIERDERGRYIQVIDGTRQIIRPTDAADYQALKDGGWSDEEADEQMWIMQNLY